MLTKTTAVELGAHKIRVNAVNPAIVDTDMTQADSYESISQEERDAALNKVLDRTPTKTFFMPMSDIVNTTLFLASDLTSQITGQCLAADGGYLTS